jgi:hypothetical protein
MHLGSEGCLDAARLGDLGKLTVIVERSVCVGPGETLSPLVVCACEHAAI